MNFDKSIKSFEKSVKGIKTYSLKDVRRLSTGTFVELPVKMKPVATFSGEVSLPFKVRGELLRPGTYKTGTITASSLKKAFDDLVSSGREVLLFTTHGAFWEDNSDINDLVGRLNGFNWNDQTDAIEYNGELYDEKTALKVANGLVKGISAGFTFENVFGTNEDIEISEGTLTFRPHCKTASVMAA